MPVNIMCVFFFSFTRVALNVTSALSHYPVPPYSMQGLISVCRVRSMVSRVTLPAAVLLTDVVPVLNSV